MNIHESYNHDDHSKSCIVVNSGVFLRHGFKIQQNCSSPPRNLLQWAQGIQGQLGAKLPGPSEVTNWSCFVEGPATCGFQGALPSNPQLCKVVPQAWKEAACHRVQSSSWTLWAKSAYETISNISLSSTPVRFQDFGTQLSGCAEKCTFLIITFDTVHLIFQRTEGIQRPIKFPLYI